MMTFNERNHMELNNTVAFVTGANRGLGLAFATALLQAGVKKVYAAARNPAQISLPGLHPVQLDITNHDEVLAAAKACGDVNLLINNAGIAQPSPFLASDSTAAIRAQFETNFFGMLAMSQAFAPVLKANGGGALVNMLSVLSWINLAGINGYSASKAAAWSLTNGLRNELRAQGTLVVGVHAAFIDTDMTQHVAMPKSTPQQVASQVLEAIVQGREEVFADEITRQVKQALSLENAPYLREGGQ
ncbi:NAD(P)-dependent dehydrogenase (short-subunit alcohol dehydrogenase family) [Undibacterium pigrum]|uniref:NAD(P)-dependent dehydrogenase (Short-subunit alcohol dehydrogenase family) n=2 Tax=Undibacterium pigrum TaxID=401470 RepID=A0A318IL13_9BURK|nr:NAD(P)-dependent dehydrogenase (short-subunit alcohol dehydrogenase family) [Undibacterium pigrum]